MFPCILDKEDESIEEITMSSESSLDNTMVLKRCIMLQPEGWGRESEIEMKVAGK